MTELRESGTTVREEASPKVPPTLGEILMDMPAVGSISGGASAGELGELRVSGVEHDSRSVRPGDLFVARRGDTHDGEAFIADAIARGAVAVLVQGHSTDEQRTHQGAVTSVPVVRVADLASGFAHASGVVYGHPSRSLAVVGITGTNGKTTTAHLARAAIDGALGRTACGLLGTLGHSYRGRHFDAVHTTPEADELARVLAVMRKRGASHAAMEVSSIALSLGRVRGVRFRVAAFTNFTQDHIDFHGSMAAYGAAKKLLFTESAPELAVVNIDHALGAEIAREARCPVLRVRTEVGAPDADVAPRSIRATSSGMSLVARVPGGEVAITSCLFGSHNVENLLLALAIASALELDMTLAARALSVVRGVPGRLERCDEHGDDIVVLVDYAHTPDALARVLDSLKEGAYPRDAGAVAHAPSPRVLCVFGCGGDRDASKRAPMGEAVGLRASVAIITSDNPRSESPRAIAEPVEIGTRSAGLSPLSLAELASADRGYIIELDRARAIALAIAEARTGDVVVVAGKGHEDYQLIGNTKHPFDDRVEARSALRSRRASATERSR